MAKFLVVFGTRPEAIKLFPVVRALSGRPELAVRTCASGQHRELLDQVMTVAGLRPDIDLDLMEPGQSLDRLFARLLVGLGEALNDERPDWVVIQGDTTTACAGALAAYHRRIPVAHVEAGLRSGDIHHPFPEEVNRRLIAQIARLHFAPTEVAATALRREGIADAVIEVTGNTGIDALIWTRDRLTADPTLAAGLDPWLERAAGKRLVLVTAHRRENLGDGMAAIAQALLRIAARGDTALLFPVHPNPEVWRVIETVLGDHPNVFRSPPLEYPHFVRALALCDLVLTDSGGVQEEAPALGKPVLILRHTTERPEGVAAGTARLVGTDPERIVAETARLLDDPAAYAAMARAHSPFGDGRAADRIAERLADIAAHS
jgi:UDP-N-acetylglucosamine 2-epimerase (non-hydrolysing)